jgi:hypothetical protein
MISMLNRRKALSLVVAALAALAAPALADITPPTGALTGDLQTIMRGIFFPNANMIFNVQTHDPATKKPYAGSAAGGADFDWVEWGKALYAGWEDIDYAAIALAEASPLLMSSGRTCQNGNAVPIADANWIKFSNDMTTAARKVLAASKTRKQETVSDSTNDLNDACQNCHRVYRGRTRCVAAAPAPPR